MDHHVAPGTGTVHVIDRATATITQRFTIIGYITKVSGGRIECDILATDSAGFPLAVYDEVGAGDNDTELIITEEDPPINFGGVPIRVARRLRQLNNEKLARNAQERNTR